MPTARRAPRPLPPSPFPSRSAGPRGSRDPSWPSEASKAWAGTRSPGSAWPQGRSAPASSSRSTATSPSSKSSRAPAASTPSGCRWPSRGVPSTFPVGEGWLGRRVERHGGAARRRAADAVGRAEGRGGFSAQSHRARRALRPRLHRHLGHRRPHDPRPGSEAAGLLVGRPAPPRAGGPDRRPGQRRRRELQGGGGRDGSDARRRGGHRAGARDPQLRPATSSSCSTPPTTRWSNGSSRRGSRSPSPSTWRSSSSITSSSCWPT